MAKEQPSQAITSQIEAARAQLSTNERRRHDIEEELQARASEADLTIGDKTVAKLMQEREALSQHSHMLELRIESLERKLQEAIAEEQAARLAALIPMAHMQVADVDRTLKEWHAAIAHLAQLLTKARRQEQAYGETAGEIRYLSALLTATSPDLPLLSMPRGDDLREVQSMLAFVFTPQSSWEAKRQHLLAARHQGEPARPLSVKVEHTAQWQAPEGGAWESPGEHASRSFTSRLEQRIRGR